MVDVVLVVVLAVFLIFLNIYFPLQIPLHTATVKIHVKDFARILFAMYTVRNKDQNGIFTLENSQFEEPDISRSEKISEG